MKNINNFHSGYRLRKLREILGLNVLELAEELKLSQSELNIWEKNGIPENSIHSIIIYFQKIGINREFFSIEIDSEQELHDLIKRYLFDYKDEDVNSFNVKQEFQAIRNNIQLFKASPKIKLVRLVLKNIGVFQDLDITIDSRLTVLVGLNGAGKSTILKAIVLAIIGDENALQLSSDIYSLLRLKGKQGSSAVWAGKGKISLYAEIEDEQVENHIELNFNETIEKVEFSGNLFSAFVSTNNQLKNLVLSIPEHRGSKTSPHSLTSEKRHPKITDVTPIITNDSSASISQFSNWLSNLALRKLNGDNYAAEIIEITFKIFSDLMGESISYAGFTKVDPLEIWVEHQSPKQTVPLSFVSQGYQSVMGWVGLIVKRMFEAYDTADNPLKQPAIVLIDEIDQLLHLKWQRRVLQILTERFFPNIQWIITTHSPVVIANLEQEQVIQLHEKENCMHAEYSPSDLWAWQYGDVVNMLFDLSPNVPKYTEEELELRMSKLLEQKQLTDFEQKEVDKLQQTIGKLKRSRSQVDELYNAVCKLQLKEQELTRLIASMNKMD